MKQKINLIRKSRTQEKSLKSNKNKAGFPCLYDVKKRIHKQELYNWKEEERLILFHFFITWFIFNKSLEAHFDPLRP